MSKLNIITVKADKTVDSQEDVMPIEKKRLSELTSESQPKPLSKKELEELIRKKQQEVKSN